jgi:PAS domain S-box-containing protein
VKGEDAVPLSRRQLEIVALLADGLTTREIAERLVLSVQTVNQHVKNIEARLQARNRAHAVSIAHGRGLLRPSAAAPAPDQRGDAALVGEAVDRAGFAVFVADESMRYLAVSDRACALLGYTHDELLRLRVPDVFWSGGAPALFAQMVRSGSLSGTLVLRRKDGSPLPASYHAGETTMGGKRCYVSIVQPI